MIPTQIHPMLALKKDVKKLGLMTDNMWVGQEKYDGERVIYQILEESALTGRRLGKNSGYLAIKTEHVPHLLFPKAMKELFDGTILDGELIHPKYHEDIKLGFKLLSSVMRSLPPLALKKQEETGHLEYFVYDLLAYKGKDVRHEPYSVRKRYLDKFFEEFNPLMEELREEMPLLGNIRPVYTAETSEEKDALLDRMIEEGKEGMMLRYLGGKYEEGKKSHHLIKVKEECDIDAVVLYFDDAKQPFTGKNPLDCLYWYNELEDDKVELGKTDHANAQALLDKGYVPVSHSWYHKLPGAVVFGCYKDGIMTERGQCAGFDYETAFDMRDNPQDWIGEVIEVHAYGMYPSGKLRHPGYARKRFDKSPEECVWEQ